ncbi:phosphotransferase [Rhizorhabdus argentea]|uniref:phosphotransferase n=1 Tax=Rhizorhabdus argentea TaxID=1387174 RepID=UPI0030EBBE53
MERIAERDRASEDSVDAVIARLQRRIAEEASAPPPSGVDDIPAHLDQVTPEWITAVLAGAHPGARAEAVEIRGGSDGSTSRRGLRIIWNEAGRVAGLPEYAFGKATPLLQNRLVCGMSGAMFNERDFYLNVRPELPIEAPVAIYAAADPDSFRSVMLFEDLAVRGAQFTDPYFVVDRPKAEDMTKLLATLHARMLGSPLLKRMPLVKSTLQFQLDVNAAIDFESRSNIGIDRAGSALPASISSRKEAMWNQGLMRSLEINIAQPNTLTHCDVHIGNWYLSGEGRMGLTDWQCASYGNGAIDLAYALSSALTTEDRRAWEADLVRLYAETLREQGSTDDTSFETQWLRYRQQMFHAFYNWVYTLGAGEMQPNMQRDDISMINIQRMGAAIDDLDSLDLVQRC